MSRLIVGLDLRDKLVVVLGGGAVAARKCARFVDVGARVRVISPAPLHDALASLLDSHSMEWLERSYRAGDLAGAWVAVDATGDELARAYIAKEAAAERVLLNVTSDGASGSLALCATRRSGALQVTVDTEGRSPALARALADVLIEHVGSEWDVAARVLGGLRPLLRRREPAQRARAAFSRALVVALTEVSEEASISARLRAVRDEYGVQISDGELEAIADQVEPDRIARA